MFNAQINRFEWYKAVVQTDLLNPSTKTLASVLALVFANDETGQINPSVKTLANYTTLSIDTVKRAVKALIDGGWLGRTEGRGRGNKTAYVLCSPGKVVPLAMQNKGRTHAPLTKQKGAPTHRKGRTHAPSYNKDKQTNEQRGSGCPVLSVHVIHAVDEDKVASWNAWLADNGFPSLQQLPRIKGGDAQGPGYLMPRRWVPSSEDDQNMVRRYVMWALDREEARYAAH